MQKLLTALTAGLVISLAGAAAVVAEGPGLFEGGMNCQTPCEGNPQSGFVQGIIGNSETIIAYSDDVCYRNDHLITALDEMALTYYMVMDDPAALEASLQGGGWDIILVNHVGYHAVSNSWDEIHAALLGGAKVAVATYDADGSNDYSGYVDDLYMAIGADAAVMDIEDSDPIYGWLAQRFVLNAWADISATVFDEPALWNCYVDDGDHLEVSDWTAAVQGWVPGYDVTQGATVNRDGDCGSVFMSWIPDNFYDDDNGNGTYDSVDLWKNIVQGFLTGATAVEGETWGGLKVLYR
jgi:hypothetical protein